MWTPTTEHPPLGARINALYDDGSGGDFFHVAGDNLYMDELGDMVTLDLSEDYSHWALAPEGYLFFFERDDQVAEAAEEPIEA